MSDSFAEGLVGIVLDGRYRLDALLGEGGMGAVYRAHHLAMDRRVAVKLLKPHLTQDPTALQRFAREARSTLKVESPHAVKVLDFGVTPHDDYYMVLEYLDGRTVQRELDVDGPFAPARVLHIAKQALRALGAAHRSGLIHRDIKPDNLLLMRVESDPDFTKVLDFGVAKLMEGAAQSSRSALALTQAGMVFGTPEFMSPEQACGHALDPRSDLYSLAATMFAMLTGCGMFQAKTAIEWLTSHARQPAPHLVDGRAELAAYPELDALLQRCFAKRPDDRPASADELVAQIEEVEHALGRAPEPAPAAARPRLGATFSPSSYIPALSLEPDPDATLLPPPPAHPSTIEHADTGLAPTIEPARTPTLETGAVPATSRRGLWLAIGAVAMAGMVIATIVVASGKKKRAVEPPPPVAKAGDPTIADAATPPDAAVALAVDAGIDMSPADAGVATKPQVRVNRTSIEVARLIANAEEAQRANNTFRQMNQADAALRLDPRNVRATLLVADALLRYGSVERACKYLRQLGANAVARQRMHSANCPAN